MLLGPIIASPVIADTGYRGDKNRRNILSYEVLTFFYRAFQAEQARLRHDNPAFFGDPTWSCEA